jgi:hypothetical protein
MVNIHHRLAELSQEPASAVYCGTNRNSTATTTTRTTIAASSALDALAGAATQSQSQLPLSQSLPTQLLTQLNDGVMHTSSQPSLNGACSVYRSSAILTNDQSRAPLATVASLPLPLSRPLSFRKPRSYPGGGLYRRLDDVRLVLQVRGALDWTILC